MAYYPKSHNHNNSGSGGKEKPQQQNKKPFVSTVKRSIPPYQSPSHRHASPTGRGHHLEISLAPSRALKITDLSGASNPTSPIKSSTKAALNPTAPANATPNPNANTIAPVEYLTHNLQEKDIRWLRLSYTLWLLLVINNVDRVRNSKIDIECVNNFIDVMGWRIHGEITADEFSILYGEWKNSMLVNKKQKGDNQNQSVGFDSNAATLVGQYLLRQLLIEKNIDEFKLNLFTGLLLNETNNKLLNTSITVLNNNKLSLSGSSASVGVDNCSPEWITLSKKLFFALDTQGYGSLRFDELFFFASCLTLGLQGWETIEDLEADFSLGTLVALTVQIMRETGVKIAIYDINRHQKQLSGFMKTKSSDLKTSSPLKSPGIKMESPVPVSPKLKSSQAIAQDKTLLYSGEVLDELDLKLCIDSTLKCNLAESSQRMQTFKTSINTKLKGAISGGGVTVSMFQTFLLAKHVGEVSLKALVDHMNLCVELINEHDTLEKLGEDAIVKGESITHRYPLTGKHLWETAVLTFVKSSIPLHDSGSNHMANRHSLDSRLSKLTKFLLCDAEHLVSTMFRAIEFPIEGNRFTNFRASDNMSQSAFSSSHYTTYTASATSVGTTGSMKSVYSANEELLDVARKVWNYFCLWQSETSSSANIGAASRISAVKSIHSGDSITEEELQRDPNYQIIFLVMLTYKTLQYKHCDKLLDIARNSSFLGDNIASLSKLSCASLIPNCTSVMEELGFEDDRDDVNNYRDIINTVEKSHGNDHPYHSTPDTKAPNDKSKESPDINSSPPNYDPSEKRNEKPNRFMKKRGMLNDGVSHTESQIPSFIQEATTTDTNIYADEVQNAKWATVFTSTSEDPDNNKIEPSLKPSDEAKMLDLLLAAPTQKEQIEQLKRMSLISDEDHEEYLKDNDNTSAKEYDDMYEGVQSVSSDNKSSGGANSITELMNMGQDTGKYAQMLREILRKMNKGDSNIHLKSLEKIIKLGNDLVKKEEKNKHSTKMETKDKARPISLENTKPKPLPKTSPSKSNFLLDNLQKKSTLRV